MFDTLIDLIQDFIYTKENHCKEVWRWTVLLISVLIRLVSLLACTLILSALFPSTHPSHSLLRFATDLALELLHLNLIRLSSERIPVPDLQAVLSPLLPSIWARAETNHRNSVWTSSPRWMGIWLSSLAYFWFQSWSRWWLLLDSLGWELTRCTKVSCRLASLENWVEGGWMSHRLIRQLPLALWKLSKSLELMLQIMLEAKWLTDAEVSGRGSKQLLFWVRSLFKLEDLELVDHASPDWDGWNWHFI